MTIRRFRTQDTERLRFADSQLIRDPPLRAVLQVSGLG